MRYSSNPLAKSHHFGHMGGLDLNIVSSLRRIVLAFTGKNRKWQTKLSQASLLTLWELITDGRFELNVRTLLRKPDFFIRGFYQWGCRGDVWRQLQMVSSALSFLPLGHGEDVFVVIHSINVPPLINGPPLIDGVGTDKGAVRSFPWVDLLAYCNPGGTQQNVIGLLLGSLKVEYSLCET